MQVKNGSGKKRELRQAPEKKLRGLINDGMFISVKASEITGNQRIFGSRFVDDLKRGEHGLRKNSRLVAQKYSDEGATFIATKAPTVPRFSKCICLSLTV